MTGAVAGKGIGKDKKARGMGSEGDLTRWEKVTVTQPTLISHQHPTGVTCSQPQQV